MEAIAAGKGHKPKPFMLQGGKVQADVVWDSRTGLAAEERKAEARKEEAKIRSRPSSFLISSRLSSAKLWTAHPRGRAGSTR
jgi:hypothetical protein